MPELEPVLDALAECEELHELAPPATDAAIASAEAELGHSRPPALRALYVGTDVARFLRGWTAYYAMLCEAAPRVLDALDVPAELRAPPKTLDEELFATLRAWADPNLPDPRADPYTRRTSVAELRSRYGHPT